MDPRHRWCGGGSEGKEENPVRGLVNALVVLAVVGFAVGLVLRVTAGDLVAARPALADPVFYWRGAIVLLALAVLILLISPRKR